MRLHYCLPEIAEIRITKLNKTISGITSLLREIFLKFYIVAIYIYIQKSRVQDIHSKTPWISINLYKVTVY